MQITTKSGDNFLGEKVGKNGNNGRKSGKGKNRKRIRPRRVPTDGDSESGQNSARGKKTKKLVLGKILGWGKVGQK